jgi:putative ABC transport system substrate-binding protein
MRIVRREFIKLLGSAVAWPLAARGQQPSMAVIGYLGGGGAPPPSTLAAFRKGLGEIGFIEGRNVAIVLRTTEQNDQLPTLVAELISLPVAVIHAAGTSNGAQAAKVATATIPIVFSTGADPVNLGLVASMNRPGGNITGVTYFSNILTAKRLELLRELVPSAKVMAFLVNPSNARAETDMKEIDAAGRSIGQEIVILRASSAPEITAAFATMAERGVGGVLIGGDGLFTQRPDILIALAARYRIPGSYSTRGAAEAGGLMSYGDDRLESNRQAGIYVGRVLKGEKPADLPVLQPTKFEFVINLKTAKTLGITFPPSFHLRADEVIE